MIVYNAVHHSLKKPSLNPNNLAFLQRWTNNSISHSKMALQNGIHKKK